MAVVGTAGRGLIVYQLEGTPHEYKRIESPLKYQHRCVTIFKDKKKFQLVMPWVVLKEELLFSMLILQIQKIILLLNVIDQTVRLMDIKIFMRYEVIIYDHI